MTIGNPAFCLALYLTGVHFRGELQHIGHVGGQKIKCRPIRTREIGGARLQKELYTVYLLQEQSGMGKSGFRKQIVLILTKILIQLRIFLKF